MVIEELQSQRVEGLKGLRVKTSGNTKTRIKIKFKT